MIHELKTWPQYFNAIRGGIKTFEIRDSSDRYFSVGDELVLKEYDPVTKSYTGEAIIAAVTGLWPMPGQTNLVGMQIVVIDTPDFVVVEFRGPESRMNLDIS